MVYTMYLDTYQLPIPASQIKMKINNQNKTINLINDGEINLLKTPGLTEFTLELQIPQTQYPFASYPDGFQGAQYYLSVLELLKVRQQPFPFICSRMTQGGKILFDTDIKVTLEDYEVTESADQGLDLDVSLTLKQFRPYGTRLIEIVSQGETQAALVTEERSAETAPQANSYTVAPGDTLFNIAKKLLGDGARYPEIYELNKDKITNPSLITAGQVLTLP